MRKLVAQADGCETGASAPTGNRYGDPAGHACLAVSGRTERTLTLKTGSTERLGNITPSPPPHCSS
jgi:nicotinamide mononucleotide (NMN) deamidase PncC